MVLSVPILKHFRVPASSCVNHNEEQDSESGQSSQVSSDVLGLQIENRKK